MKRFLQRHQSPIAALGITVVLALWLLSGTGATGSARDPSLEAPRGDRPAVTRVRVKIMESQRVIREVIIYGKTEAARSVKRKRFWARLSASRYSSWPSFS